jgi:hypothetical protein
MAALTLAAAEPHRALVEFRVAGGILAMQERLVVFEDGAEQLDRWRGAERVSSFCGRLDRWTLERLRASLERAGCLQLAEKPANADAGRHYLQAGSA